MPKFKPVAKAEREAVYREFWQAKVGLCEMLLTGEEVANLDPLGMRSVIEENSDLFPKERIEHYHYIRRSLAEVNLALAYAGAKIYGQPQLRRIEDLEQDAVLGLMVAIDRIDGRVPVQFGTYACWWIRNKIQKGISENYHLFSVPAAILQDWYAIERIRGESPGSSSAGFSSEKIDKLDQIFRKPFFLDRVPADHRRFSEKVEEKNWSGRLVVDPPLKHAEDQELRDSVSQSLRTLPARHAEVVRLLFGLDGREELPILQVAKRLGVTRERVRQIYAVAIEKLRRGVSIELLD